MSDSWEAFAQVLREEVTALVEVERRSTALTLALIGTDHGQIDLSRRALEEARKLHVSSLGKRRGMQHRGFGKMSLMTVCGYAPPRFAYEFNQRLSELVTYATAVKITTANNKALILAGMERLMRTVSVMQQHAQQNTGTYRRRGNARRADSSVIVSKRV